MNFLLFFSTFSLTLFNKAVSKLLSNSLDHSPKEVLLMANLLNQICFSCVCIFLKSLCGVSSCVCEKRVLLENVIKYVWSQRQRLSTAESLRVISVPSELDSSWRRGHGDMYVPSELRQHTLSLWTPSPFVK